MPNLAEIHENSVRTFAEAVRAYERAQQIFERAWHRKPGNLRKLLEQVQFVYETHDFREDIQDIERFLYPPTPTLTKPVAGSRSMVPGVGVTHRSD